MTRIAKSGGGKWFSSLGKQKLLLPEGGHAACIDRMAGPG